MLMKRNKGSFTILYHTCVHKRQRKQVLGRCYAIHTTLAVQLNAYRGFIAILNTQNNLATSPAWSNRLVEQAVVVACSDGKCGYSLVGIIGLCSEDSGALGA